MSPSNARTAGRALSGVNGVVQSWKRSWLRSASDAEIDIIFDSWSGDFSAIRPTSSSERSMRMGWLCFDVGNGDSKSSALAGETTINMPLVYLNSGGRGTLR